MRATCPVHFILLDLITHFTCLQKLRCVIVCINMYEIILRMLINLWRILITFIWHADIFPVAQVMSWRSLWWMSINVRKHNLKGSQHRHVNTFHYPEKNFKTCLKFLATYSDSGSQIRLRVDKKVYFCASAMFFFSVLHKNDLNGSCMIFKYLPSYRYLDSVTRSGIYLILVLRNVTCLPVMAFK